MTNLYLRSLIAAASLLLLGLGLEGRAIASPHTCPQNDANGGGCVESCELQAGPETRASDLFLAKLRTMAPTGLHVGTTSGPASAAPVSQFRVASIPLKKEAAARWRQNGLWAGPCSGLAAVFEANAVDDKDPKRVVDLYELRYTSEPTARRVAALLGTSWEWNGHPFITVQRGPNVIVAEGRYGAWSALETVGAHFGGAIYPRRAPVALPMCDKGAKQRPIFQVDSLAVHILGFAPSGELAWLEETAEKAGGSAWTLHVANLVNDHEVATKTYRTVRPGAGSFCAQYRMDAGALLAERGVTGGEFPAFDKTTVDGAVMSVLIQPAPSSGSQIVMQGPPGTKVLGRLPASAASANALGFLRSPFEERVAVLVSIKDATGRPGLRVLGGRLDKRWGPRQ